MSTLRVLSVVMIPVEECALLLDSPSSSGKGGLQMVRFPYIGSQTRRGPLARGKGGKPLTPDTVIQMLAKTLNREP